MAADRRCGETPKRRSAPEGEVPALDRCGDPSARRRGRTVGPNPANVLLDVREVIRSRDR